MQDLLKNQVAVVTGASRGIGEAIALNMAKYGADVVLLARNAEKLEQTAQKIRSLGRIALPITCDIKDIHVIPQVMAQIQQTFPALHIWVNNAGISQNISLEALDESHWDTLMDINLKAAFFWSQAVFELMKKDGGKIIHIASIGGQKGARNNGLHYVASKGGLIALSKGLALNGAPYSTWK